MAIQPIDLQTLYSQMDKVSKNVAYQERGVHLNRDVNQADQQKKIDEQRKAIEKAQKDQTESDKVRERSENRQHDSNTADDRKKQDEQAEQVPEQPEVQYNWITDSAIGNHIDISG